MQDRPAGITDEELAAALERGWRIGATELRYAPVGAGSYHWTARDRRGARWFVTVDDLDAKPWLGDSRAAVFGGLREAMGTAVTLREQAGLAFVVAPVRAAGGEPALPLGPRHAVAVFPLLEGLAGDWRHERPAAERREVIDLLAALHQVAPRPGMPRRVAQLPLRGSLERSLRETGQRWDGGPFSEAARELIAAAAPRIRERLAAFDRLAELTAGAELVVTHGEPHPANMIRADGGLALIDWDTVGLAPPERDLWDVVDGSDGALARHYAAATGRAVSPDGLALYRLRWALDDLGCFLADLRAPHTRSADAELAWEALSETVAELAE